MASYNDYVVNELLRDVALGYKNENYVAERILPRLDVPKKTGVYYKFDKSSQRVVNSLRAPKTRSNVVEQGLTQITFGPIAEHSLDTMVDREEAEEIGEEQAKQDGAELIAELLMVEREVALATTMSDTAILTQTQTLSGSDQWSHSSGGFPFTVASTAKSTIQLNAGKKANTMVVGYPVHQILMKHPDVLSRISGIKTFASESDLAAIFEVDTYIVADATYNSAKEGQTDASAFIWGKHAWFLYVAPEASKNRKYLTFGHTLMVTGDKNTGEGGPVFTENWEQREKSWAINGEMRYEQKLMAVECAYFVKNAVA